MTTEPTERVPRLNSPWAKAEERRRKRSQAIQFGDRVRSYRCNAGLSQTKAGQQAGGISLATWASIEGGNTNPLGAYLRVLKQLQAIASVLGCTLEELTNCD